MTIPIVYHGLGIRWCSWSAGRHLALMRAMAQRHPVIILDAPDLAGGAFRQRRPRLEHVHDNLHVVRNAFGWRAARLGRRLDPVSAYVDAAWTRAALRRLGCRDYVLWMGSPAPERARWMNTGRMVYDCLDPCFDSRHQVAFDRREENVATRSHVVFASADRLVERMRRWNANVYHLPNAADPCFAASREGPSALPEPLRGRPRPVIGYMGTLDGRFDFEAIRCAAAALPDFTFCLVGRVNGDQEAAASTLRAMPNVMMPGPAHGDRAVAYNHAFDVGLVPFRHDPLNDCLDPVKLYMYFMTGKPVVAAATRECRAREHLVYLARGAMDWINAVRVAATEDDAAARRARTDYAMMNTWDHRAEQALQTMRVAGLLESANRAAVPMADQVAQATG